MPTTGTRFIYVILDKVEEILDDSFYQEMLEISPEFMKKFQHDFKVSPTALLYPRCIIIVEQTPKTVTKLNGHLLNILQIFFSILSWKFCLRRYQIYLSLKLTSGPLEFMKFGQICYSVFKNLTTALLLNRILEFWLPRDQYIPGAQKAYEPRTL